jgi:ribosomal protein S18 acetylase RimI-like enzyme
VTDPAEKLSAPVPLTAQHDLEDFDSGEPILDDWLRGRALGNMDTAASKTYVVCLPGSRKVIGFYALCMGQILNQEAIGAMRRNMPHQIPAVILGRLAIDRNWQRQGIGAALLHDAVQRSFRAAEEVSARLLIVHATSAAAEAFYRRFGFTRLPVESPTLAIDLLKLSRM